jgi:fructose-1-phosphate kinase PfkB-like protein
MISEFVSLENENREKEHLPGIYIIVDPKNNWRKFLNLSDVIIKPNIKETIKELSLDIKEYENNLDINHFLQLVAEKLYEKYSCSFQNYIITLGKDGAALVNFSENKKNVYWFPAFDLENNKCNMSAHCGDVFDTALGLAMTLENCDIFSAIQFANCAGFLQYRKGNGQKIILQDLLQAEDLEYKQKNSNYIKIS